VHRIGHHFPLDIIDLACSKFAYKFTDKGGLEKATNSRTTYGEDYFERGIADYRSRQALHGRPILSGHESKDLIRGAVREMFPKIPEADLTSIVNHAFEKVRSAHPKQHINFEETVAHAGISKRNTRKTVAQRRVLMLMLVDRVQTE
jgi:hypothetical protein